MEKPGKVDYKGIDTKKIPFSGKLGGLGNQLLQDFKRAKYVTSMDWRKELANPSQEIPNPHKKPVKSITHKPTLENFTQKSNI